MKKIYVAAIIALFAICNTKSTKAQNLFPDSGKVGIGTRAPATALEVSNTTGSLKFDPNGTSLTVSGPILNPGQLPRILLGFKGDNNAAMSQTAYQHDNVALAFDAYPNGGLWSSSHLGSNFSLYKANNELVVGFKSNIPVGGIFTYDVTSGVRFSNDGKLGIGGAAGAAKLYVNGNVGIGTNAPAYPLDVNGTIRSTGNIVAPTVNNISIGQGSNNNSFAIGNSVINGANNTSYTNFAIGGQILNADNFSGYQNVGVGIQLLQANTTGFANMAFGGGNLSANTTGSNNIAVGLHVLMNNTIGSSSVAVGSFSLGNATIGSYNTAMGMYSGGHITSGGHNTFLGCGAGMGMTTGNNNIVIGFIQPGGTILGLITGSGNTIIGSNVSGLSPTLTNHIILADGVGNQRFIIDDTGNAGIGTSTPDAKLTVNGTMHAKEVKVNTSILPDYVFDKNYDLASLKEVKTYIDKNHHLPEIPSAQQVAKEGLNLGEMNTKLLKKIEELTLYLIEKDTEIKKQQTLLTEQQKQLDEIKRKLNMD